MATQIHKILAAGKPALIGRFGTIEFEAVYCDHMNIPFTQESADLLEKNAGVFPCDVASIKEWAACVKRSIMDADVLAVGWYPPIREHEKWLLAQWGWQGEAVVLRSLEPYYSPEPWSLGLSGKVCVVSSFAETAAGQMKSGAAAWERPMFGDVEWHWVRTGYAPRLALGRAGWEGSPESWKEAVDWVVGEVMSTGARVVIIGCGGLGMLIGAELKRRGKICIVMGGAVQVLFGIKGRRWEGHEIQAFWNSEWVWPGIDETPGAAEEVEGGCYWGGGPPK